MVGSGAAPAAHVGGTDVLFISSNGAGMGHLTRLTAYQRRLPRGTTSHVLSLSQAAPVVERFGLSWEYLPSAGATGLAPATWRGVLADRLMEILHRTNARVVVFDGTNPYPGIDTSLAAHPATRSVWSRRGMWRPGAHSDNLRKSRWFDLVLEPGDLAQAADHGGTTASPAARVNPVTLLDVDEVADREAARRALGLSLTEPTALVTLGAGNINDTRSQTALAINALRARGFTVVLTRPTIAAAPSPSLPPGVVAVSAFPLSEHLAAFDVAVSAAGYNSFHELLRFGVPTLFVPNRDTSLDDQVARAAHADAQGWARHAPGGLDRQGVAALDDVIERGPALVAAARAADPGNGAREAAMLIAQTADGHLS